MSIRTILAAASGGTASDGAIELACRFALRFGAHVEGLHVRADPRDLFTYSGDGFGMAMSGEFIDKFIADTDSLATATKAAFQSAIARHGIVSATAPSGPSPVKATASAIWREETGRGPARVSQRARFFDLVVLGRSERVIDEPHSDAVEQTLINSGRPVLLAPATAPDAIGNVIAIGWNGSPEAVRALVAARPFLAAAQAAIVITIGDKHHESAAAALDYLGWSGIAARHLPVPTVAGVDPGQQLLSAAHDEGADLLVIGAYSRSPWREYLFGGTTRDISGVSLLPLLLSH